MGLTFSGRLWCRAVLGKAVSEFRRLMELRHARDQAKAALETAEKEYREYEADINQMLSESSLQGTLKLDLGEPWGTVSFLPTETYYGKVVDKEKAIEYYERRVMVEEVSEPKFVMARINEEVRQRLEEGQTEMPPGITYVARRGVRITRQKG